MSLVNIPTTNVTCSDGTTDVTVGINPNSNTDDKVQAFVNAFKTVAQTASNTCYGLPVVVILAMWGGESGWATATTQNSNQNWSNMGYNSATNPVGNIGQGIGGWAKFEGRKKHANGFAYWFRNNSRYSGLISYLQACQSGHVTPDRNVCVDYIANAGYGGSNHTEYANRVKGWITTLVTHSNAAA